MVTILSGRLLFDCGEPGISEGRKIIILELGADLIGGKR